MKEKLKLLCAFENREILGVISGQLRVSTVIACQVKLEASAQKCFLCFRVQLPFSSKVCSGKHRLLCLGNAHAGRVPQGLGGVGSRGWDAAAAAAGSSCQGSPAAPPES